MTIRAVDPVTRRPLPEGEIGELAVCGYVTPGYYRAPELDAEAFDRDGRAIREFIRPIREFRAGPRMRSNS
jgi:non-ribosomal peptide synthetase component E (peptide arylation enzyme)